MSGVAVIEVPETPPADTGDARVELANLFLHGDGLEIGALHLATALPPGAHARYVDRMSVSDLRAHYPELQTLELAPVDVIDDGERLDTIEPESVDFIVANHFLEHCEDPIRTIQTHLSKLKPGGTLFYAVPDKRYTFDFQRPRTTLEHVIEDHEHGPEHSRAEHYLEWATLVGHSSQAPSDEQARAQAEQLQRDGYSIHFHVWTQADLAALMFHIHQRLGNFEVETIRRRSIENIVVLRKHGEPPTSEPDPTSIAEPTPVDADVSSRVPVALAGLRARLDHGSAAAHWSIDPDGLAGRAWVLSTVAPVTVPLVLDGPARLHTRAQLLPHDWRDAINGVDASIEAILADGQRVELWDASLTPADELSGLPIDCLVPEETRELRITISERGILRARSISRMALIEPYLTDPRSDVAERPNARPGLAPMPTHGPLISVLCPVHDPPVYMLREAIESIRRQSYGNWELVVCDDGSRDPDVIALLDRYDTENPRVTLTRRQHAGGISTATNSALAAAVGEYVAMLDHDDTLERDALAHVVALLNGDPSIDMVYTDEAVVADGELVARHLKPDWSPELIEIAMYTTHLGVYRRSLAVELGGFSPEFDGTQDYDFVLRLSDRTDRIAHVPEPLYHWRAHADSTAGGDQAKPYAYAAQPAAIAGHLRRRGINADVQHGAAPGLHRIVHRVDPELAVTIVVAVQHPDALYEAALVVGRAAALELAGDRVGARRPAPGSDSCAARRWDRQRPNHRAGERPRAWPGGRVRCCGSPCSHRAPAADADAADRPVP